nr:integrase, catalytic region, zinc finger, CCHC-type, peptidase aspartic, catalytic [Tanacetum cinerariifolium]
STPQVSKGLNNAKVIAPGMFRISLDKIYREAKKVTNTVNSSRRKNKDTEVEDHHRNLLLSKNTKHISSACNNSKIDSHDVISKVVCAKCKKCLISVNHDKCVRNYVNGKRSRGKKQKSMVSFKEIQMKYRPKASKPKNVGTYERLATLKPRKPRFLLRWSPTGKMFDQDGKLVAPSNSESHVDCSNGDRSTNLYTINLHEMASASPICLMDRASSTKSWLWHQRLSHLNFDTINDLAKNDLVV